MFRVADVQRKGVLCDVLARILMFHDYTTAEGEYIPFHVTPLPCDEDSETGQPLFLMPWTVTHIIGPSSPLYGKSRRDLEKINAQFVLVVEGIVAVSVELPNSVI